MKIKNLNLENFRNYSQVNVDFFDGVNIIQGKNAQGKTNLLEAIFFCSIGKSLRVGREKEIIKFNENNAKINIKIEKKYKKSQILIYFSKNNKKSIKIDNISIKKIGELLGEFNAIYFSPDELKLIKESPEDRRRFIDIHISQISKQYFYLLNRYEKILANRNKLLKNNTDTKILKETIEIWNTQLIDIGSKIILYRIDFINKLLPYAKKSHSYLTSNDEILDLEYSGIKGKDLLDIKTKLQKELSNSLNKDIKLGFTNIGPHRDDIKIFVNKIDIKTFGSQGQQRTVALSLKLAELEIMKEETGEMPILLLDDVLSELDKSRKEKLLKFCSKTQTFITGTEFEFNPNYHYFTINNGNIKK
ncbi:MAG: DNA replication/repair protein RecF [Clostridia bacterium]|nr:DNA replication/repair protein RecF [Clostridia bacterium]